MGEVVPEFVATFVDDSGERVTDEVQPDVTFCCLIERVGDAMISGPLLAPDTATLSSSLG